MFRKLKTIEKIKIVVPVKCPLCKFFVKDFDLQKDKNITVISCSKCYRVLSFFQSNT